MVGGAHVFLSGRPSPWGGDPGHAVVGVSMSAVNGHRVMTCQKRSVKLMNL